MTHELSEAELIEIERLLFWDGNRRVALLRGSHSLRIAANLQRFIDLARSGQLCAECGARIEPYSAPGNSQPAIGSTKANPGENS